MRKLTFLILICGSFLTMGQLQTRYEQSGGTETATYGEAMDFYRSLDEMYEEVSIGTYGTTDFGLPLHVVLLNTGPEKTPEALRQSGKVVLLINNAIHPGEPDGITASQMFARDLMLKKDQQNIRDALDKVAIAIIPFYNIGGTFNRNSTTRVNQNGPESYGFRGNARHYDLNRDFIKSDTENSRSFQALFQRFDPDLFLDTHVSNGADYQHIITLVNSQKDKMGGKLGAYIDEVFMPFTYRKMEERGFDAIPYVNAWGKTPDKGWPQFLDLPRYSTGYAALFHTIGYMSETHMLKTFQERVSSTYSLMETLFDFGKENGAELQKLRQETKAAISNQKQFEVSWRVDTSRFTPLEFSGYEPTYVESAISGLSRLKYDRSQPFTREVRFMNHYRPDNVIQAPEYYLIPQQWQRVIQLMKTNQVEMIVLENDTTLDVETYTIEDYETVRSPYEGHYRHYNVKLSSSQTTLSFRTGDILIPVNQWRNRYIVETLEPQASDSFFAWNFFDSILQQKEHFSSYVFEDHALKILAENPEIKKALEEAIAEDPALAERPYQQLDFIYQRSEHREPEYLRYPIFRIMEMK